MTIAPFARFLSGADAFYLQPDYVDTTREEMAQVDTPKEAAYRYTTCSPLWRRVKTMVSIVAFPVGLYYIVHALAGKLALLPASSPKLLGLPDNFAQLIRQKASVDSGEWKYKRISVLVDGRRIDAAVMGRASTMDNGRWTLVSNGNGQFWEEKLGFDIGFRRMVEALNSNVLVFNYPGVGNSEGWPSAWGMVDVQHAMKAFLVDEEKGIGAHEVIVWGHSIGAGVQGDALSLLPPPNREHPDSVRYVFVKSRTFDSLSSAATSIAGSVAGFLVWATGWNFSPWKSSISLSHPEIVLQTANVREYTDLTKKGVEVVHDGIIPAKATLAPRLISEGYVGSASKKLIGMPEGHNDGERRPEQIAAEIEGLLASQG